MERIRVDGIIIKAYKGTRFDVRSDENPNHIVFCTLSGKMRQRKFRVNPGDAVIIEISPYDLTKGRIVWRKK